jgi:hypothetical protein
VIIGVGPSKFEAMIQLDGDQHDLVDSKGKVWERDIVQFLPYQQYAQRAKVNLAAKLIEEVPAQIDAFCLSKNFVPEVASF